MARMVYLLEDNDAIREMIEFLLEDEGYGFKSFCSVSEFNAARNGELPDVYLLDVMLPDGNGLEVCDGLKEDKHSKHVPVLIMSANTAVEKMKAQCSAEGFISKPFDIDDLAAKIDRLSGKHLT